MQEIFLFYICKQVMKSFTDSFTKDMQRLRREVETHVRQVVTRLQLKKALLNGSIESDEQTMKDIKERKKTHVTAKLYFRTDEREAERSYTQSIKEQEKVKNDIKNIDKIKEEYLLSKSKDILNTLSTTRFLLSVGEFLMDYKSYQKSDDKQYQLVFQVLDELLQGNLPRPRMSILECLVLFARYNTNLKNTNTNGNDNAAFVTLFNTLLLGMGNAQNQNTSSTDDTFLIHENSLDKIFDLSEQNKVKRFVDQVLHAKLLNDKTIAVNISLDDYKNGTLSSEQNIVVAINYILNAALREDFVLNDSYGTRLTLPGGNLMYQILREYINKRKNTNVLEYGDDEVENMKNVVDLLCFISTYRPIRVAYDEEYLKIIAFKLGIKKKSSLKNVPENAIYSLYDIIENYFPSTKAGSTLSFSLMDVQGTYSGSNNDWLYDYIGECAAKVVIFYLLCADLNGEQYTNNIEEVHVLACLEENAVKGGKRTMQRARKPQQGSKKKTQLTAKTTKKTVVGAKSNTKTRVVKSKQHSV